MPSMLLQLLYTPVTPTARMVSNTNLCTALALIRITLIGSVQFINIRAVTDSFPLAPLTTERVQQIVQLIRDTNKHSLHHQCLILLSKVKL